MQNVAESSLKRYIDIHVMYHHQCNMYPSSVSYHCIMYSGSCVCNKKYGPESFRMY